jgi:acetamidase/formamidase
MGIHRLTKDKHVFKICDTIPPALFIEPGDTVVIECQDAWNGVMKDRESNPELELNDVIPATGPIYVNGAEPGDALEIHIEDVQPRTPGMPLVMPGKGYLKDFPGKFLMCLEIKDGMVEFSDNIKIPIQPHPGFIAVAPGGGAEQPTRFSGPYGGNMDCKEITNGATLYLPVFAPGGLLFVGDGHAVQGDGEVCVSAAECDMEVRLKVAVIKNASINMPRVESEHSFITIGIAEKLDDALTMALRDMIGFLQQKEDLTPEEAYVLCSLAVDMRINQLVNRQVGIRAVLPKKIFTYEQI